MRLIVKVRQDKLHALIHRAMVRSGQTATMRSALELGAHGALTEVGHQEGHRAITQNRIALESLQSLRGEYAQDHRAASLAAKLVDTCVSASFRPALWLLY
jgi:hypothetical protein